jgi:two-component system, chemotaxis family, chemotaxis protein CheY
MLDQGKPQDSQRGECVGGRAAMRLLAIDADTLHRMIICRIAAKAGYVPAGAATCAEAIKLVQKGALDCITIDLALGPHGGVELLNYIQLMGCRAPIIVVGECDDDAGREILKAAASLNLKIWQTMPKPADFAVLRHWLDALKAERETAAVAAA